MFQDTTQNQTITVLGKTFNTEEERRKYFREELRKQLPELKQMEGFPIGEDEDILNLSDPPFYTACPNPWLNDFIDEWEKEKNLISGRIDDFNMIEPYAVDVSEGKNNPIYNAHSYHTKVPHPAIMRYILHYTQPGDIILDGFAGTGMTSVAAQLCENPNKELKHLIEEEWLKLYNKKPIWGIRKSICSDLSPIATLLASNFSSTEDIQIFEENSKKILNEFKNKLGDLYTVIYKNKECEVNYILYSDVNLCPNCNEDIVFWGEIFDYKKDIENVECKSCGAITSSKKLNRKFISYYDPYLNETIQIKKTIPVQICINYNRKNILVDVIDLDNNYEEKLLNIKIEDYFPIKRMPVGDESRRNDKTGITHIHHFYSKENLKAISILFDITKKFKFPFFGFFNTAWHGTIMRRYNLGGGHRPKSGTLYIPSLSSVGNIYNIYENKLSQLKRFLFETKGFTSNNKIIHTASASCLNLKSNSIDYIFTDPPFGANIMYSELNFIWENWIRILTNIDKEAIENKSQNKGIYEYQNLMVQCFSEFYRVLKPNKWMTVEFSNPSAAIWNSIQNALQKSGFIIANVSALDKKQGSINSYTTPTAVKQDLVISCYKPLQDFNNEVNQNIKISIWDFVNEHLNHLPIHIIKENATTAIIERSSKILFDRLISFYVQRNLPVPIDAIKFQQGLREHFIERDGMFFTNEQVQEYDLKKKEVPNFIQLSILVSSEQDGVLWLKNFLQENLSSYQDIQPQWMQALAGVRKGDVIPELAIILEENFLKDEKGKWYIPNPENEIDLEKMRSKRLLKQFESYKSEVLKPKGKLKEVRVEALRAGFKQCYQDKDFKSIVTIGDRIPNNVLMEDEVLLQFYDIASSRV
jgi:DNA modification methylase